MSGEKSKVAISRRDFLKASAVGAGALSLAGATMTTSGCSLLPVVPTAKGDLEEHFAYTYHQSHCGGHCSFKCTVRDGRLALIQPNPNWSAPRYKTCCLKGLSEVQHIYGPTRIQTPLKRVGERGENKFVAISWDEALSILKEEVEKIWKKKGKEGLILATASEASAGYPHLQRVLGSQGNGLSGIDTGLANGLSPMIGDTGGYIMCTSESRDWVRARNLIVSGCNFLETSLVTAKTFFEAKEAGCHITVIDPHFSTTAGKAHEWVPIEPATDGALFLGMVSLVLDKKWYDERFMKEKTSFPFLIDLETGALLRQNPATDHKQKGAENPFLVYNPKTKAVESYLTADDCALEGVYEYNGKKYTTVFEHLKQKQKPYTVEWASQVTTIPVDTIERLTRQVALEGPTTISLGWGGQDKYANSDVCGHAVGILMGLTGNLGKPGASVGNHIGGPWCGWSASLEGWPLPPELKDAKQEMASYEMRDGKSSVIGMIALGDIILQKYAAANKTKDWFKSLDFLCSIDVYHTTTCDWADLILPAASRFESNEEIERLKVAYGHVLMQGKIIDPLFEAHTDSQIEREIAALWGLDKYLPKTQMDLVKHNLEKAKDPKLKGMTIEALKANNGILPLPGIEEIRQVYDEQIKNTASGRLDVYYENLVKYGQELPEYTEALEVTKDNPLRGKYPLALTQPRTRFHIHNQYNDATWIQQFYEPYIEMNKVDMDARGLKMEDIVEVFNDRGGFTVRVRHNEAVRPGCARIIEGSWDRYLVKGGIQECSNDKWIDRAKDLVMGPVLAFNDTLVEIKKA